MTTPSPRHTQTGLTIIEVSLGLGAAAVLGLAAFGLYRSSEAAAKVKLEQAHISSLAQAIESSLGMVGSFSSVSVERVLLDRLAPATLIHDDSLRNAWGGPVEVAPYAFTQSNDSFAVAYGSVPAKACSDLGSALGSQLADLKVNGQTTMGAAGLNPASLASRCREGGTMLFVFHSGLASGEAVATTPVSSPPPSAPPPSAPPSPPGTPVAPPVAPPVVVTPPIVVTPPPAVGPPGAPPMELPPGLPPTELPPGIPPGPPAAPPPYTPTCLERRAPAESQSQDCAAGEHGVIGLQREQICLDGAGNPSTPATYEPWGDPVWTSWATTSNSCTPCPSTFTEPDNRWVTTSGTCPSGQTGTVEWERAQTRSRTVVTSCPAGTRTLPAPVVGAWGAWSDTGATRNLVSTCVNACPYAGQVHWVVAGYAGSTVDSGNPAAFPVATVHSSFTPAQRSFVNSARATAPQYNPPNPFEQWIVWDNGPQTCASTADAGNISYRRVQQSVTGPGMGDGGGFSLTTRSETIKICASRCDLPSGWGLANECAAYSDEVVAGACPAPLSGSIYNRRNFTCPDLNGSPILDYSMPLGLSNPITESRRACTGNIGGNPVVTDPNWTTACPAGTSFPFGYPYSLSGRKGHYGGRCGTGNQGFRFFSPAVTTPTPSGSVTTPAFNDCVYCEADPPPYVPPVHTVNYWASSSTTAAGQTCNLTTNYARYDCDAWAGSTSPSIHQTFHGVFPDSNALGSIQYSTCRGLNFISPACPLGKVTSSALCVDGTLITTTDTCVAP